MTKKAEKQIPFPLGDEEELDLSQVHLPENLVSPEDAEDLLKWMMGMTTEPPATIQKLTVNLAKKLNVAMAYLITMNVSRMKDLSVFMKTAEDYLFDEQKLANMEDEQIASLYMKSAKVLDSTLEFCRKFIVQNKHDFDESFAEADRVKVLLSTLPADKLKSLADKIEKGDI